MSVAEQEPPIEVRLLNFPLQLFVSAREHHAELLREFALLAVAPPGSADRHLPRRLIELIDRVGREYGGAGDSTDLQRDQLIEAGQLSADLTYQLPASAAVPLLQMHELFDEADEYCQKEELLTLAATPAEREFRRWFLEEFTRQLAGMSPRPWNGPLADDQV